MTLIWDVPQPCPAAQPDLPIYHQPRQNQAKGGTAKIKVNPTDVRQEMVLPVASVPNILTRVLFRWTVAPLCSNADAEYCY